MNTRQAAQPRHGTSRATPWKTLASRWAPRLALLTWALGSGAACKDRSAPGTSLSDDKAPHQEANPTAASPPPGDRKAGEAPAAATAVAGVAHDLPLMPAKGERERGGSPGTFGVGQGQGAAAGGIAPSPRAEAAIDANGRFATTYRPGGGHLASFESAIARGILKPGERELVSDVGARYAPTIAPPKDHAMAMLAELERDKLPPSGGPTHLRVTLRSTDTAAATRPHLSVHLVLDVSGSMKGESIEQARNAARALVDKLAPTDDFSLVTFSSDAEVKAPDGPVGPRREQLKKIIDGVVEGGGTNISKGLELGYAQAKTKGIPDDAVRVVLLLSDGRANAGTLGTQGISSLALGAFQDGVQTSSFGLGEDYDGELMSAIASEGAGGYYYMRNADQISPSLATEIDKRLDPVATAVEVRVRLKKGVELLAVYGSKKLTDSEAARVRAQEVASDQQAQARDKIAQDRKDDKEGGLRFFIPAFARDDAHSLLFKLRVPEGVDKRGIADIEIRYKDRIARKNVSDETPVSAAYAASDAASAGSINASVTRTVQGFAAGETLAEASTLVAQGQRDRAVTLLAEREALLRRAAETLSEPLFLKDADRLARLREHAGSQTGAGDPLVLAMLLETASRSHLR